MAACWPMENSDTFTKACKLSAVQPSRTEQEGLYRLVFGVLHLLNDEHDLHPREQRHQQHVVNSLPRDGGKHDRISSDLHEQVHRQRHVSGSKTHRNAR